MIPFPLFPLFPERSSCLVPALVREQARNGLALALLFPTTGTDRPAPGGRHRFFLTPRHHGCAEARFLCSE